MISVAEALDRIIALVPRMDAETVPLRAAAGRVLLHPVTATRNQPPFAASAMDGYAVRAGDATDGAVLRVIGEAAAGSRYTGPLGPGQAVRIFTGAPVPAGADRVVIQEDVTRDGDQITISAGAGSGPHVRPAAADFAAGDVFSAPKRLNAADIALLAAMNAPEVRVARRPVIALIATGDELVPPGGTPGDDQIIASNAYGLAALLEAAGAEARLLPIARDRDHSLIQAFKLAEGADVVVTIGGASVGDHDIVRKVAEEIGMQTDLHKVAMRPGKPLMAGRIGSAAMIGLPGNPVSAMICGHVFLRPAVDAMLGLAAGPLARVAARLTDELPANGPREHYMRARLSVEGDGLRVTPEPSQDSALLSVLAGADALLVRPVDDPARSAGDLVQVIRL